jgi:cytochrome d ubiquinol oxidase subunit II
MTLRVIWYILIGFLLTGYAILDGFDLGVGVLHRIIAKTDRERRILLNSIGPVWDGNEVWILTGGGALFAAFPQVYATVFSGFYLALMLLLYALIFRAVSFEFRSKVEDERWRNAWDWAFTGGSFLPALLYGVAIGNVARGVPIDADMEFAGNFFTLLNPYALLIGLLGLAVFVMHGALYLTLKTEGELAERAARWAQRFWLASVVLYGLTTIATVIDSPQKFDNFGQNPVAWLVVLLSWALILYVGNIALRKGQHERAFLSSAGFIASLMIIFGISNFPYILPAINGPEYGLTIYNASSSDKTLQAMLVIALIGMPIVIAYTAYVYNVFKGKVRLSEESYY